KDPVELLSNYLKDDDNIADIAWGYSLNGLGTDEGQKGEFRELGLNVVLNEENYSWAGCTLFTDKDGNLVRSEIGFRSEYPVTWSDLCLPIDASDEEIKAVLQLEMEKRVNLSLEEWEGMPYDPWPTFDGRVSMDRR